METRTGYIWAPCPEPHAQHAPTDRFRCRCGLTANPSHQRQAGRPPNRQQPGSSAAFEPSVGFIGQTRCRDFMPRGTTLAECASEQHGTSSQKIGIVRWSGAGQWGSDLLCDGLEPHIPCHGSGGRALDLRQLCTATAVVRERRIAEGHRVGAAGSICGLFGRNYAACGERCL